MEPLVREGLQVAYEPEEVPPGARVVIRSHGIPEAVYEMLRARGAEIIDATCPRVLHIHRLVRQAWEQGRTPMVIGDGQPPGGAGDLRLVPGFGGAGGRRRGRRLAGRRSQPV